MRAAGEAKTQAAPPSPAPWRRASILLGHHHGQDRLALVACPGEGLEPDQRRDAFAVVVADVDGEADFVSLAAPGGQGQHPKHVPQPAGLALANHTWLNGAVREEREPPGVETGQEPLQGSAGGVLAENGGRSGTHPLRGFRPSVGGASTAEMQEATDAAQRPAGKWGRIKRQS